MSTIKLYFGILDFLFPQVAARKVYQAMSNPRIRKLRDFEEAILDRSKKERIPFKDFELQTYAWGNPDDKVAMLVHGWEGQAGNFGNLIDLLLEKNYYVIAFDGPSHGHSSKGKTSMFEFSEFVTKMFRAHKPKLVISHSFGSVNTAFALKANPEIKVDQWIMITTPFEFKDRIQDVADMLGITNRTLKFLYRIIKKETNTEVSELSMANSGGDLPNLKEALILHSKTDKVLPIEWARKANDAIPQSELIELDKLGHYKILWAEELKKILKERIN